LLDIDAQAVQSFLERIDCGGADLSLSVALGGERNWDYRYSWIRDAAFAVYAIIQF